MKTLSTFLLAALLTALPSSCKSSSADASADVPCRCGTAQADLEGCAHPACRAGKTNPDNPDCVCGQLEIPAKK
jgi:hypothetical protein